MKRLLIITLTLLLSLSLFAQKPYRVGTTAANFLEVGQGGAACGMGQAYVAAAEDMSSVYWNPAGMAYLNRNEIQFSYQPWIASINTSFASVGILIPGVGVLAASVNAMNFGRTEVTTIDMQEGTGETYAATDMAATFSYARKLAQWFAFGASAKFIHSSIWHMSASSMALDLGVRVDTEFFAPDGKRENGLSIGMSISNYGGKMKYDGMDLLQKIDIDQYVAGNYGDVEGQFRMQGYELPLIMRLGTAWRPIVTNNLKLTIALDALHPNNNSEYVNAGGELAIKVFGLGTAFLRGGYHGLFMDRNQYGLTLGGGVHVALMGNMTLKVDYAYQELEYLDSAHMMTLGMTF